MRTLSIALLLFASLNASAYGHKPMSQTMEAASEFAAAPLPFESTSPKEVATYLTQPFKTNKLKAWVLYVWIAKNITYDRNAYIPSKASLVHTVPSEVLEHKKTTCLGYANLYTEMAASVNLETQVVLGYIKGTVAGSVPAPQKHAWNVVKLDGTWFNLDITCYDPLYPKYSFMLDPEIFKRTHYAEKREQQYAKSPLTLTEFQKAVQ